MPLQIIKRKKGKKTLLISREELLERIMFFDEFYKDKNFVSIERKKYIIARNKALICFLYLTGARVSEVVKYSVAKDTKRGIMKVIEKGDPITLGQVDQFKEHYIIKEMRILKNREPDINRDHIILIDEIEKDFINMFNKYVNEFIQSSSDYLFNMSRYQAYKIVARIGLYPHYLRHLRTTHLVQDYGFTSNELMEFHGWKSISMTARYSHLDKRGLLMKMKLGRQIRRDIK